MRVYACSHFLGADSSEMLHVRLFLPGRTSVCASVNVVSILVQGKVSQRVVSFGMECGVYAGS